MATKQVLGKVSMVMRGEYNNETEYNNLDVVTYDGSSYVAKGPTLGNLPTDPIFWVLLAKKGDNKVFDSLQKLKEYSKFLNVGDNVKTLGYYELNDGGGADYHITDTLDETKYQEQIGDLYAELIIKNDTINFKQLGAKCNEKIDCKPYLDLYIDICNKYDKTFKLIIDEGIWYFSPTLLHRKEGVWIEGCGKFRSSNGKTTQISPLNEEQDYIWKLGGTRDLSGVSEDLLIATRSCVIKKICFAGNTVGGAWSSIKSAFYVDCCMYCTFDELYFQNIWGTALTIRQSWELYWGILNFRGIGDFTKPCIYIPPITNAFGPNVAENVSANYFNYIMFEGIDGDYIYSEGISGFEHNEINDIQIELSTCSGQRGTTTNKFNEETYQNRASMIPNFIFKGFAKYLVINMINIFTSGGFYSTNNGNNYYIGGVIGNDENETSDYYGAQDIAVNMIKIASRDDYPLSVVYSHNVRYNTSLISLTNVTYYGFPAVPFDVVGGTVIKIGNYFNGSTSTPDNSLTKGHELYKFASNNVLYYDEDSISLTKMVLAGNIERNLIALAFFNCEGNKNFKLRIKGENGIEYRFRLQGYVNNELKNIYFSYTGTGNWEYYTCENCNFDDGKIVQLIGSIVDGTTLKFDTIELTDVT